MRKVLVTTACISMFTIFVSLSTWNTIELTRLANDKEIRYWQARYYAECIMNGKHSNCIKAIEACAADSRMERDVIEIISTSHQSEFSTAELWCAKQPTNEDYLRDYYLIKLQLGLSSPSDPDWQKFKD